MTREARTVPIAPESPPSTLPWHEYAARLIEKVPGVVSATIEGPQWAVAEVRVWYEPTWPVGDVVARVHSCLTNQARARLAGARLRAVVAEPDRRVRRRARPERLPAGASGLDPGSSSAVKFVAHRVKRVQSGVVGVEVWIEVGGRTFSGAALGPDSPPGSLQTPALATLRAVHSSIQVLYSGVRPPGLVLESVVEIIVGPIPVAVVTLTASENARARFLTAASANEGDPHRAVILAVLQATSRTLTRWMAGETDVDRTPPAGIVAPRAPAVEPERLAQRLSLVDFEVVPGPLGTLDVGVRLAGLGGAANRRRSGKDKGTAHLRLGASVTLDAVHDLLTQRGWDDGQDRSLRDTGAYRLRTGQHDIVVVLVEASVGEHTVPLAGATSADDGVERASITAALQATNPLVANHSSTGSAERAGH